MIRLQFIYIFAGVFLAWAAVAALQRLRTRCVSRR